MTRLHRGMNAELLEGLGGGGADGAHPALAQSIEHRVFNTQLARDAGQVRHLDRGGEKDYVELSGGEPARGLAKRPGVLLFTV